MVTSVLDWLDARACDHADKNAYICGDAAITFKEIADITKSVGTYLAGKVSRDKPVVCMSSRHPYTPAYFLSIVRAGCAYAPIDSTMPVARLQQMLEVADADYMLVDKASFEKASTLGFKGEIIVAENVVDTPADEALLAAARANLTELSPLYIIFTSGSTGKPKGVITSHHSLMCYIDAVSEVLDVTEDDVFGGQAPLDYIAAVRDIYFPLKAGASTVIIPKSEFAIPTELFNTLNRNKVTALCWSVAGVELPAKLNAFSECKPEYLKKVCFSGSVMSPKLLRVWQDALPDVMFVNQYGPTESTASCTYYVVRDKVEEDSVLPIGRPYKHYSVMLLKEDNTPAAPGETGEICVTGPCLALGYYRNAEKTAESFMQNPLNDRYRELIYKTGDLGSFNPDGELMFHGRKDRQIKHMGHRIELEEIEGAAKRVDGVRTCCSLYQKEKELLYLFYTGDAAAKEITLFFRAQMPAFMVPRKIIRLDEMPALPNGKTDMNALKAYFK